MEDRSWSPRRGRLLAILAVGGLLVSACGSSDQLPNGEVSIGTPALSEPEGVEFGDSLDEWSEAAADAGVTAAEDNNPPGYELMSWDALIPPGASSDDIFAKYEDRLAALEDGSPEADAIYEEMQAEYDNQELVNDELDGAKVNMAGFVAPLSYEDDIVTEFLLVPYFGACIHVPAPPPNQTVLVTVDKSEGLTLEESWGAVWVAGTMTVDSATTELATANYTMTGELSGVYDEYG